MSNRIYYLLRSLLQNSKLNREKFVKNKKTYNELIKKNKQQNYNKIITRKMSTYIPPLSFRGGGGPKKPNNIFYMFLAASSVYISSNFVDKKK
jgi:hypothetical protein